MRPGLTIAFATRRRSPRIGRYLRHLRTTCGLERAEVLYRVNLGSCSLAELYNQFLDQASHPIVCLIHDDLVFARGSDWGRQLVDIFKKFEAFGALSAAGSVGLEAHAVYWTPLQEMVGTLRHRIGGKTVENSYSEVFKSPLEVLVLDGLLLAVHKDRIKTRFDERIGGFHFYDIAFSLAQSLAHQRGEGGKCGVVTGLGVTHLSGGDVGPAFESARQRFLRLYGSVLPRRLRPDLRLRPLPAAPAKAPRIQTLILHREARVSAAILAQRLLASAYERHQVLILNASGQTLQGLPEALPCLPAPQDWDGLRALLMAQAQASPADLLLLLDSRVLPLQDWLPAMAAHFSRHPDAGTLGVRLHYPDTHLIHHNGLRIFHHPDGRPDVVFRGIHSPYLYRNALEWNPDGSLGQALMLRREAFLALGGLGGQDWVPGLELNLLAKAAGLRNAVDSRLVGYWLAEDGAQDEMAYQAFLAYFAEWAQLHLSP